MHFHSQTQTRPTGGFLSPSKHTTRHHDGHHHSLGLGTSGAATTSATRRSPGTGGLFHRRARVPRTTARTSRTSRTTTTTTSRRSGGGLFGGSNRRAKKSSVLPVTTTTSRRRPSLSDRINGAFLKLKGSLTRNPREKAIGDRQMHGRGRRLRR
ncbi:MAG: hypothetical protein STHCBS139747_000827 [Sporothrix thermara]